MAKKQVKKNRFVFWVVVIILFYVFTSAKVSVGTVEISHEVAQDSGEKIPFVVEKLVNTTKYKEEKVPYGVPDCQLTVYNFSSKYTYEESFAEGKKAASCTFFIINQEDMAGNFTFYPQFLVSGNIHDGPDIMKPIGPFGNATFQWNFTIGISDTGGCLLQSMNYPQRMKCTYLEPITYQIKQIPYTVEEMKNVTEYRSAGQSTMIVKENVTGAIYTNRFFGYRQFFYLGY